MRMLKRGQGATEYLLMLAAVLVIVAIAVYYITATPVLPAMTMHAELENDGTNVEVKMVITAGELVADDYKFKIINPKGEVETDWTDGTTDLTPLNSPVLLDEYTIEVDNHEGTWTIKILYEPAGTAYKDFTPYISFP
jgi:hypothetical protein